MRVSRGFDENAFFNGLGQGITGSQMEIYNDIQSLLFDAKKWKEGDKAGLDELFGRVSGISIKALRLLPEPLNREINYDLDIGIIRHNEKRLASKSATDWKEAHKSLRRRGAETANKLIGKPAVEIIPGVAPTAPLPPPEKVRPAKPAKVAPPAPPVDLKKILLPVGIAVAGGLLVAFLTKKKAMSGVEAVRVPGFYRRKYAGTPIPPVYVRPFERRFYAGVPLEALPVRGYERAGYTRTRYAGQTIPPIAIAPASVATYQRRFYAGVPI